jgi:hypothetical protein
LDFIKLGPGAFVLRREGKARVFFYFLRAHFPGEIRPKVLNTKNKQIMPFDKPDGNRKTRSFKISNISKSNIGKLKTAAGCEQWRPRKSPELHNDAELHRRTG